MSLIIPQLSCPVLQPMHPSSSKATILLRTKKKNGISFLMAWNPRNKFSSIFLFTKGLESRFIYVPYQVTWNSSQSLGGRDPWMYFIEHYWHVTREQLLSAQAAGVPSQSPSLCMVPRPAASASYQGSVPDTLNRRRLLCTLKFKKACSKELFQNSFGPPPLSPAASSRLPTSEGHQEPCDCDKHRH